jgi:hypothetical protein
MKFSWSPHLSLNRKIIEEKVRKEVFGDLI